MVENIEEFDKVLCRKCHRELKDEQSRKLGFGPICYKKYMNRKRSYLFEMEEPKMNINKEDISTFYLLLNHYNLTSSNIGVIDTKTNFIKRMKKLCKSYKDKNLKVYITKENTKYTFLIGDIERTYIQIENENDLEGKYFRQFI